MRITNVKSLKDAARWLGDQALHALIALAPVAPFATQLWQIATAGATILTIREIEQGRDTVERWLKRRKKRETAKPSLADLMRSLHLPDRVGDVVAGTILSCAAWTLGQLTWRAVS